MNFYLYDYLRRRAFSVWLDIHLWQNDRDYAAEAPLYAKHHPILLPEANRAWLEELARKAESRAATPA